MSDYLSIEEVRCSILSDVVSRLYDRLTSEVIDKIKAMPSSAKVDYGDAGLASVWEEYKYQFQSSDSTYRDYYEAPVRRFCDDVVSSVSAEWQQLLWMWTDEFSELWADQDNVELSQWNLHAVKDKVYQLVCDVASDEVLLCNPEDEEARIQHEEDSRLMSGEDE